MRHSPLRIFFSAGEPSGDIHAANLIRELRRRRPDVEAVGYGGPSMAEAGCRLHADLTALAVMWFARAIVNLHKFYALMRRADRYFRDERPDAVVLVDYPGFNWWIARRAKAHGIPVFYYTPPQIWAWATWRVKKMRRLVDHVLCSLPFEEPWFRERGCRATFVGHPFFDEVRRRPLDEQFLAEQRARPGRLVTILPGSRNQEVANNLKWFLRAAAIVREAVPDVRFAIAAFKEEQAEMARGMLKCSNVQCSMTNDSPLTTDHSLRPTPHAPRPTIDVYTGRTPELMHLAKACMACSGSVSIELLYHTKPTVILYWINRAAYWVQGRFRRVKYITLVNLLAAGGVEGEDCKLKIANCKLQIGGKEDGTAGQSICNLQFAMNNLQSPLFPEYLTCEDRSREIAGHVIEWLTDEEKYAARVAELEELKRRVGAGGAAGRAADYIVEHLERGEG